MLALSVAAVLAVFLLYVSIAGGRTAQFSPSELKGHKGLVSLVGRVVGPVQGAGYAKQRPALPRRRHQRPHERPGRLPRQRARPVQGRPRTVVVDGRYEHGTFVAKRDTLVTKCPSKYAPAKS